MTSKSKKGETLELHASPIQARVENTSASHAVNHSEIRRRAYEIYLERGGLPGSELEIGSRPNTSSNGRLFSHETEMAFNNDIARTPEIGIDIRRTAKRERKIQ
ncbi:MAG: hypothetical protein QOF56_1211 [Acidobacteriaceae bacterium]|nr:hypothetical protein [Acidobacteriaceae bacterium]